MTQPTAPAHDAAQQMFDADKASQNLGIELVEAGDGRAVARMRITAEMVNGHGIAHGGFMFLLADTAFACACNSYGPVTVAAGADIPFIAPARQGDLLTARAEERTRFGRSGIYDVTVLRGTEVIAEFRGRSRTIGGRSPSNVNGRDHEGNSSTTPARSEQER